MALCEARKIIPRVGVLYRFEAAEGCDECASLAAEYIGHEWANEPTTNASTEMSATLQDGIGQAARNDFNVLEVLAKRHHGRPTEVGEKALTRLERAIKIAPTGFSGPVDVHISWNDAVVLCAALRARHESSGWHARWVALCKRVGEKVLDAQSGRDWGNEVLRVMGEVESAIPTRPEAAPDGWRDIASAPKDGRKVLLAGEPMRSDMSPWTHIGARDEAGVYWDADNELLPPTHWMPLPQPPVHDAALRGENE